MAGGLNLDDDDGVNSINITPFVDVVLVLLVVFMVASSYIVKESIEVDLPKAATGGETLDTTLSLVVNAEGALYLNGEPTTEAAIAERCRAAAKADENAQAIIAADKATPHGKVVRLIDLIRQNGVLKFAINIDPEEE